MAKNKTTYTLEIDAELGSLEHKLATVKELLSGVLGSDKAPKGLEKAFEKIEGIIDKVKAKASEPITTKAGFSSITKDVDGAQVALASLLKIVNSIASMPEADGLSFLPPDAQAQIEKIVSSLSDYATAMDAAATESEELATARTKLAQAEERVATAQAKVASKEANLEAAKAEKTAAEQGIALIEERKRKLEELREEQQKIEDFYNTPNEDGTKKNRSKKYDGVSMRPQDIKRQIRELEEASAGDEVALEGFNKKLKQSKEDIRSYQTQVNTANRTLRESKTEHEALTRKVEELEAAFETDKVRDQQAAFSTLRREAAALGVDLEGISESYSERDASELISRITALKTKGFDKIRTAVDGAKENLDEFGETCKNVKGEVEAGTEAFEEMSEAASQQKAFEDKIKSFLGIQGAAQLMRAALRDAIQTITELDATMADMAVVTDLNISDYWNQLPEYTQRANDLGLAIGDVYKADTLFYQQGLKTNEVVAISTETMKMASIAGLDTAEATDRMTAALRGFNMELNEASAQKIADVYSELAAITAADVDEISTAMTKTASIASSAGMEFETTAAFLSQIIETTRESAETAGTAMKTVIARFQELKKSPDEIGEVDGEIVDANAIETALRSVGVSLRDAGGQFRELDDVFLELSSKWDGLDKNTQRYIATIAAGSRQQSRFIAMMSDYKRTTELVTAANNSAGASQEQFEKKVESLGFKINQLKNAWHEFTMGIMESDLVKTGVEILTKFLEIVNKATSGIEGLGGSLTKIVSILGIFKLGNQIFAKFRQPIIQLFADIVKQAGSAGTESMKAYKEGAEREKNKRDTEGLQEGYYRDKAGRVHRENGQFASEGEGIKQKPGKLQQLGAWGLDQVGYTDYFSGNKKVKSARQQMLENKKLQQSKQAEIEQLDIGKGLLLAHGDKDGAAEAERQIGSLRKEIEKLSEEQLTLLEEQKEGWIEVGEGIQKFGGAVTSVGVATSVLGGIFSSLGLEELGESFAQVGNWIMIAGSAISFFGTIVPPIMDILAAKGLTLQAAFWPILVIGLAIAALVGIIIGIVAAINHANAQKIENRMKAAAEATEEAKQAAEEAKEAYDKMLDDRNKYNELQQTLEDLTYGTNEWKQALIEANQQVLELLQTYPELAKYLTRGEDGQLAIKDEGWNVMLDQQQKAVKNSQALYAARQLDEQALKQEKASEAFTNKAKGKELVVRPAGDEEVTIDYEVTDRASKRLQEELMDLYLVQGSSLEENIRKVHKLADKYHVTTDAIWDAANALNESKGTIQAIAQETENIARANLTAIASDKVMESKYGEQVIDAFATAQTQAGYEQIDDEHADKLYANRNDSTPEKGNNEYFDALASEYGVSNEMTGDDIHDYEELYKAMAGVEEIPDGIKGNSELLRKAIAEMDVANSREEKMNEYVGKLEQLSAEDATNIAGLLSQEGTGMSADFAEQIAKGFKEGEEGNAALEQYLADTMGYSIEEMADALNMTVDDYLDAVQKNTRLAQESNTRAFKHLNKALGTDYNKFGEKGSKLSAGTSEELASRIVSVADAAGIDSAKALKGHLDSALGVMGEKAESFGSYISNMNWQEMSNWDELPEVIKAMGLDPTTAEIANFIAQAKQLAGAVDIIDLSKLNKDLKNTYELLTQMRSGEQRRSFDEDTYKMLISSNKDLANDFIQIGDTFHYVGSSIDSLTEALIKNTLALIDDAKYQHDLKIGIVNSIGGLEKKGVTYGDKTLSIYDNFANWSDNQKRAYLEAFQNNAQEAFTTEDGKIDPKALSVITNEAGESLGMSFSTNFQNYAGEELDRYLNGILNLYNQKDSLPEETQKLLDDSIVTKNLQNSGKENIEYSIDKRGTDEGKLYARAASIQAAESGIIAEAAISKYNELSQRDYETLSQEEKEQLATLENTISTGLDRIAENQEATESLIELQNRVADAIYNTRQKEIDKLSEVNESVQAANGSILSKLQEQIDTDRQERANQEAEKNIADLQAQQAYLAMDTSGANALGMTDLDKQIADAEQAYQDTLIDQAIQKLSDANEKAAEQRERQIELLQMQLDNDLESGRLMREAEKLTHDALVDVNNGLPFQSTAAGEYLRQDANLKGLSAEGENAWNTEVSSLAADAAETLNDTTKLTEGEQAVGPQLTAIEELVEELTTKRGNQNIAINQGAAAIKSTASGGFGTSKDNSSYQKARDAYVAAGGRGEDFDSQVREKIREDATGGDLSNTSVDEEGNLTHGDQTVLNENGEIISGTFPGGYAEFGSDNVWGTDWDAGVKIHIGTETITDVHTLDSKAIRSGEDYWFGNVPNESTQKAISALSGSDNPDDGWLALYQNVPYIRRAGKWVQIHNNSANDSAGKYEEVRKAMFDHLNGYTTGGLADFTGPAWLDGTPSKPEYVLNAAQTERFFSLVDVLEGIDTKDSGKKSTGDNYFDIEINVDKLENDYDVEQVADKIRRMIYEDATYRNVNAINHIR